MKVIVTGESKYIESLIRESKVRISRGMLTFEKVKPKGESKPDPAAGQDTNPATVEKKNSNTE
jgi:hypothetical protein